MKKVQYYMDSNRLALNGDKTQILINIKNTLIKENFRVIIQGK